MNLSDEHTKGGLSVLVATDGGSWMSSGLVKCVAFLESILIELPAISVLNFQMVYAGRFYAWFII